MQTPRHNQLVYVKPCYVWTNLTFKMQFWTFHSGRITCVIVMIVELKDKDKVRIRMYYFTHDDDTNRRQAIPWKLYKLIKFTQVHTCYLVLKVWQLLVETSPNTFLFINIARDFYWCMHFFIRDLHVWRWNLDTFFFCCSVQASNQLLIITGSLLFLFFRWPCRLDQKTKHAKWEMHELQKYELQESIVILMAPVVYGFIPWLIYLS